MSKKKKASRPKNKKINLSITDAEFKQLFAMVSGHLCWPEQILSSPMGKLFIKIYNNCHKLASSEQLAEISDLIKSADQFFNNPENTIAKQNVENSFLDMIDIVKNNMNNNQKEINQLLS